MKQPDGRKALFIVLMLSLPFYIGLGAVHLFDWDEINFAESAREMIASQNFLKVQIGFEAFWEKPPLFFWLQSLTSSVLGVNETAARLPNAICGTLTLVTLFRWGKKIRDVRFGLTWVCLYAASLLPHFYFKFGVIDPVFNLFIFNSILWSYAATDQLAASSNKNAAYIAGCFSGLAVLTKGPVGFLLLTLTFAGFHFAGRFRQLPAASFYLRFGLIFILIVGSWLSAHIYFNGFGIFLQFMRYQVELFTQPVAGHKQPFYYHFLVVLFGCFPMSFIALPMFGRQALPDTERVFLRWMFSLFWVVMILFSITTTKIIHYSSMSYLPLSYLATYCFLSRKRTPSWIRHTLWITGTFISLLWIIIPWVFNHRQLWINMLDKDRFAYDSFNIDVDWPYWISVSGILMLLISILIRTSLKNQKRARVLAFYYSYTVVAMISLFTVILPRIEQYTQGPAIEFAAKKAGAPVYLATLGYKSYVPYYYFRYPAANGPGKDNATVLLDTPQDKPVFIMTKSDLGFQDDKRLEFLYQKGGFRFYQKAGTR